MLYILHLAGVRNFGGIKYFVFPLLHYTVMIGLTIVISSREEKEDEMIRMIRLKSFQYGLYLNVFVSIVLFLLSIAGNRYWHLSDLIGMGGIDATLIYIVVIYQFKLFTLKHDEE